MIRDSNKVYEVANLLQKNGIFTVGIVYPAVRIKEARIRVSVLATHEEPHLDQLANSLIEINQEINFM